MKIQITNQHKIASDQLTREIAVYKNTTRFHAPPDTIVIHYSAGASAESSAMWLADERVKASAHVVIGRDGALFQLVPFDTIAWHAGPSSYGGRFNLNHYSLGIELDNAGFLASDGDGFVSAFGKKYPESEVIRATHQHETFPRCWHTFTEKQLAVCEALCAALIEHYPISHIVGHDEIAPDLKLDPGPAFPMNDFRKKLLTTKTARP